MAKGKISASSGESEMSGRNIKQINETERLKVIMQKVTVGLTPDLIKDIDCEMFASKTEESFDSDRSQSPEESINGHDAKNDVTSLTTVDNQEHNGTEVGEILQLQSNGFTPISFYGSRSKHFTPNMNILVPNTRKTLWKENEELPMVNTTGVKRKLKKGKSSIGASKKCRTSSGARQHKNMTKKDKLNSDVNDKDVLVDIDNKDIQSKSKKKAHELVMNTVEEVKDSGEGGVTTPQSDYDSEESGIIQVCNYSKSNIRVAKTVVSEVESTCSEASLCSGPGRLSDGFCLQKNGNEYYFSSSSNVSPEQLTSSSERTDEEEEGIGITRHTINSYQPCAEQNGRVEETLLDCNENASDSQSSISLSTPSPDTGESVFTQQLSGKEEELGSSKSSPEHQASITRYFATLPGPKCKTKTIANGVPSSSMHPSVGNSPEGKYRITPGKKKSGKKQEQMYLDLGQKDFGHVTCPTCGMVYTRAQPDDEAAHIRHHKSFVNGLKFTGWKNECVVKEYHDGRVIMVSPDDPRLHLKKIEEVRKVVDSELGFVADAPYRRSGAKTFLFITTKKVVGCAVAIQIDQGYPVLPSPEESSTPEKQIAAWCCSTTPQSAQCGISRIWVHSQYRRKKVATRLLDCVRTNFIYGCIIPRELVAFSDPTPDGKRLANSYAGTSQFLVFR